MDDVSCSVLLLLVYFGSTLRFKLKLLTLSLATL
jgi:hypothetical protein